MDMVHVILSLWCACLIVEPCGVDMVNVTFSSWCLYVRINLELWSYLCRTFKVGACSITMDFFLFLCLDFTVEAGISCNPGAVDLLYVVFSL